MRQNNISAHTKKYGTWCWRALTGMWIVRDSERKLGKSFFLDTFKPDFQRVFEPFPRVFKVFPHSKGFRRISKFQELVQIIILRSKSAFVQPSLAFKLFAREKVAYVLHETGNRDNWVLSTGLIMWINHRKEIRKLSNLFTVANSHYQPSW